MLVLFAFLALHHAIDLESPNVVFMMGSRLLLMEWVSAGAVVECKQYS
jgi:hypothetical protein